MVRNGSQQEEAELLFEAAEHGEGQNHKALARVPHQEVGPGTRFPWAQGTRASAMRGRPGLLPLVGACLVRTHLIGATARAALARAPFVSAQGQGSPGPGGPGPNLSPAQVRVYEGVGGALLGGEVREKKG